MNATAHKFLMQSLAKKQPGLDTPKSQPLTRPNSGAIATLLLGIASAALYGLLYHYDRSLVNLAMEAHNGHRTWFFVPILVALTFSLAHGAFTGYFWDMLGIKAKKPDAAHGRN
jgi:hypothetical protein